MGPNNAEIKVAKQALKQLMAERSGDNVKVGVQVYLIISKFFGTPNGLLITRFAYIEVLVTFQIVSIFVIFVRACTGYTL
jgi:hypothetical protein